MRRHAILLATVALIAGSGLAAIPSAQAAPSGEQLDMYTVRAPAADAAGFARSGLDVVALKPVGALTEARVVLSAVEREGLQARGFDVKVTRDKQGRSASQRAAAQAAGGYNVWRSWDEPGGIRDELHAVARANPQLVKLEVLGHTHGGRELLALKLTQSANRVRDGVRPAVLYRGRPSPAPLLRRPMARERHEDQAAAETDGTVVRRRRQPRRLSVHLRSPTAVAEEPSRQQRRRPDHRRRRRRPEPQLQRALEL
jgi:hypothetical protein